MSVHAKDPVDDATPVFTQGEVFQIGGFLAERWGVSHERVVDDIEDAVRAILNRAGGSR